METIEVLDKSYVWKISQINFDKSPCKVVSLVLEAATAKLKTFDCRHKHVFKYLHIAMSPDQIDNNSNNHSLSQK